MAKPSNTVTFLNTFLDGFANIFYDSSIVTAYNGTVITFCVEGTPISWVECDCDGSDENVVVSQFRDGNGFDHCIPRAFSDEAEVLLVHGLEGGNDVWAYRSEFSPCTEEHVAVHLIIEVEYANAHTVLDEYAIFLCPLTLLTYTSISNLSVNHSGAKNQSRLVQIVLVL